MQTETEAVWSAKRKLDTDRPAALEALIRLAFTAESRRVQDCAAEALLDLGVHVLGEFDRHHSNVGRITNA